MYNINSLDLLETISIGNNAEILAAEVMLDVAATGLRYRGTFMHDHGGDKGHHGHHHGQCDGGCDENCEIHNQDNSDAFAAGAAPGQPFIPTTIQMNGDDFAGDSTTTGVVTIAGPAVAGNLEVAGDDDWFAIEIKAGQTVRINMTGDDGAGGLADPFVRLYDSEGNLVGQNDDISLGVILDSSLLYTATDAGTYYVSARAFGDQGAGTYTISVVEDEPATLIQSIDWGTNLAAANGTTTINVYFQTAQAAILTDDGRDINALDWTEYEIQQFMIALDDISNYIDVEFVRVMDAASADFRLIVEDNSAQPGALGSFFPPQTGPNSGTGVFNRAGFGWDEDGSGGLEIGGFGYVTIIHEIGHGLGLAHPHDGGGTSVVLNNVTSDSDAGAFNLNQSVFTIMSYVDGWREGPDGESNSDNYGYVGSFSPIDLAVLQAAYGANETTNAGNTIYTIPSSNVVGTAYIAIWDTGGIDTIRAGDNGAHVINLNAATLEYAEGGGGSVSYRSGVYGGFTIANGAVIENADGGNGNDTLIGNAANNFLRGAGGDDIIEAGAGDDVAIDGNGNDIVRLGEGNDRIEVRNGADTFDGGEGTDIVSFFASRNPVIANIGTGEYRTSMTSDDTFISFEGVWGSQFGNDRLTGSNGNDELRGFGGNDQLMGLDGDDLIIAHAGDDLVFDGLGNDTVILGAGNDFLRVGSGADVYDGGPDRDYIDYFFSEGGVNIDLALDTASGGWAEDDTVRNFEDIGGSRDYDDVLLGDAVANFMRGYGGNDILNGRGGDDELGGGRGNDTFVYLDGFGNDIIRDFRADEDILDFSDLSALNSFADVMAAAEQVGANTVITVGENSITLNNLDMSELDADDFFFGTST